MFTSYGMAMFEGCCHVRGLCLCQRVMFTSYGMITSEGYGNSRLYVSQNGFSTYILELLNKSYGTYLNIFEPNLLGQPVFKM